MKALSILFFLLFWVSPAWAMGDEWEDQTPITQPDAEWKMPGNFLSEFGEMLDGLLGGDGGQTSDGQILLGPIIPNAYGPGVHSDATGKPFTYQPDFGGTGFPDPTLKVKPNAYGPGVGMDQYGRPVRPRSWP